MRGPREQRLVGVRIRLRLPTAPPTTYRNGLAGTVVEPVTSLIAIYVPADIVSLKEHA